MESIEEPSEERQRLATRPNVEFLSRATRNFLEKLMRAHVVLE